MKKFKEYGFLNHRTNKTGMVRDHIFARKFGYELKIPYFILRHPSNLQLLSNSGNISKGNKEKKLPIDEKYDILYKLLNDILEYKLMWHEQQLCVNYINEEIFYE